MTRHRALPDETWDEYNARTNAEDAEAQSLRDWANWDAEMAAWQSSDEPRGRQRQAASMSGGGVVYVLESGGRIKIGFTQHLIQRMATLQRQSPFKLRLVHTAPGGTNDEAALHQRFASCRLHGEWFEPDEAMRVWLEGLQR